MRAMDAAEQQHLLREGIAAIKAGQRARGHAVLARLVEANPRFEPAWLWLAVAVDDPRDQLIALDNVLTLNPNNTAALERATQLRRQLGLLPAAEPTPPPPPPAPKPEPIPAPLPEETFQCVYCGQPTHERDRRCPHCGRNLMTLGKWKQGGFQYVILIVCGLYAQLALVQVAGAAIAMAVSYGFDPLAPRLISQMPGVPVLLGDFFNYTQAESMNVWLATVVRSAAIGVLLLMFYTDLGFAYEAMIVIPALDAGWSALAVTQLQWMTADTAAVNVIFDGVLIVFALTALLSRRGAYHREFVTLDPTATNALALYVRGRAEARKGKWATAALHWQRAAALKPTEAGYVKDLARALAHLGRHEQALEALERGAAEHSDDPEFQTLIHAIKSGKA